MTAHSRHSTRWLLRCLVVAALLPAGAAATLAAGVSVVGALTREMHITAGVLAEDSIELTNTLETPAGVRIYQTDYLFSADGRTDFGDTGTQPRSNASWISISPQYTMIPAGETASIRYTVQPPAGQNLRGTYWSVIMVEPLAAESAAERSKPGVGIRVAVRYAIQVVTHIGEPGERAMEIANKQLCALEDGSYGLSADVACGGERSVRPTVWVELHDAQGSVVTRAQAEPRLLLPGCAARFTLDLGSLAPGPYSALLVADDGEDNVIGVRVKLEVRERG